MINEDWGYRRLYTATATGLSAFIAVLFKCSTTTTTVSDRQSIASITEISHYRKNSERNIIRKKLETRSVERAISESTMTELFL